MLAKYPDT